MRDTAPMAPHVIKSTLEQPYIPYCHAQRPPSISLPGTPLSYLRLWSYADNTAALRAPELSHHITGRIPLQYLHPAVRGPVNFDGQEHKWRRQASQHMLSDVPTLDSMRERADRLVTQAGASFDLARLADQMTYETVCDMVGAAPDMYSDAVRRGFFRELDKFGASSPFLLPTQGGVARFIKRYLAGRREHRTGRKPIDDILDSPNLPEARKADLAYVPFLTGTITTSYVIAAALAELAGELTAGQQADFKEQAQQPGSANVAALYEETLRRHSPAMWRPLKVIEPVALGGHTVKGGWVQVCWSSANRDPSVFEDPHNFKLDRPPNKHIALSVGRHACIGRDPSRLMATALIERVLAATDGPINVHTLSIKGRVALRMRSLRISL